MNDLIGIPATDTKARRYCGAAPAPLGIRRLRMGKRGPVQHLGAVCRLLWPTAAPGRALVHAAFAAPGRALVRVFRQTAFSAAARNNGAPRPRRHFRCCGAPGHHPCVNGLAAPRRKPEERA